jgi:hypothetical protein
MRTAIKGALLATGAILATAGATTASVAAEPATTDEAAASQTLVFNKSSDGPTSGRVHWTYGTAKRDWQAGSGNGGNWNNECVRNEGHLPNGRYRILGWHRNYDGSVINGRAVHLEDKQCTNGTWRTELFVHSEQTVNNTQGNTEGSRWDGDEDYKSEGCVKMNPGDIEELFYKALDGGNGAPPTVMTVVS